MTGSARAITSSPHSPPCGREGERVFLPARVLAAEARLHLGARQPFPAAVIDLAQTRRVRSGVSAVRGREERAVSRVRCSGLQ